MGNKQYKQFTINTLEDGCLVLKSLIVPVIINLDKFKAYSQEAKELLDNNKNAKAISANEYDEIHDKVLYRQLELLRFIADHQSSSFSYIGIRSLLVKKGFLIRGLSDECQNVLKELLDVRNWSFHNAQSMLVAELENAKKTIPAEFAGIAEIKPVLNPVIIPRVKDYSRNMLESFINHNSVRTGQFEMILDEMKKDYQEMWESMSDDASSVIIDIGSGRDVHYIEQEICDQNPKNAGSKIASLSMGIQKGKYDGSELSFKEWT